MKKINFKKLLDLETIETVRNSMNDYLPELYAQDENLELTKKMSEIFSAISSFNNRELLNLFIEYSDLKYEEKLHENSLAYYVGFEKGANSKKVNIT